MRDCNSESVSEIHNKTALLVRCLCTLKSAFFFTILAACIVNLSMPVLLSLFRRTFTNMATDLYSMAFVTAPDKEVAKRIASGLVEKKIAACVNIIPGLTSVYEWEGKIEEDSEVLMMIKTRTARVEDLTKYVIENHPYDTPEVISAKIDQGSKAYLDWIGKTVPEK